MLKLAIVNIYIRETFQKGKHRQKITFRPVLQTKELVPPHVGSL